MRDNRYAGLVFTLEGLKVDPVKGKAIEQMTVPSDKAGVQKPLGMVNNLSHLVPKLTDIAGSIR